MPICQKCDYEYVEGITVCPVCGASLVDESTLQKPDKLTEDKWKVVYTTNNEYEVEMMKDNLEGAGIAATILSHKDRNFPAPGNFSLIKLLVKENDIKDALNYIQETKKLSDDEK